MESLDDTQWDVIIVGTGLHESLLALALSRSGKRILHVDKNNYYGAADAALSLQEAEAWAEETRNDSTYTFSSASVAIPTTNEPLAPKSTLAFSRAYCLALSPQIIYTRSQLLSSLVSSRVDTQVEFLAVGSWWVYSAAQNVNIVSVPSRASLIRVPSGREDVVADPNTGPKAKRALIKFLRFIGDFEQQIEVWEDHKTAPFEDFLAERFALPSSVHEPLLSLTMACLPRRQITTSYALPRIARHLRSIGVFGPGFGAVIPKWGGLAEVAQVGCRAGAVGGGVYVLGNGIRDITSTITNTGSDQEEQATPGEIKVRLESGSIVTSRWVVGSREQMSEKSTQRNSDSSVGSLCRSICIISSPLSSLFPPLAEGSPTPAAAIVAMSSSAMSPQEAGEEPSQICIMIHSSDTGECPSGQSVLYASVTADCTVGFALLDKAVEALLSVIEEQVTPTVLWKLQYEQKHEGNTSRGQERDAPSTIVTFPTPSLDLTFDDGVLNNVRRVWEKIMDGEGAGFLQFPQREGDAEHEDEE